MPEFLTQAQLGLTAGEIALCLAVVVAAAFLRGFTGFGFALAAVPLLALLIPPARAVPFVLLLQLMGGLWDWREARKLAHWPSLPWLIAGAVAGTPLGTLSLATLSADAARLAIGLAVLVAVALLARGVTLAAMPGRPALAATGLFAGLLNGVAAMPGPPVIVLFLAGAVSVAVARASLLIFFLVSNATGAASAAMAGLIPLGTVTLAALAFPLFLGAQLAGRHMFVRAGAARYRQVALIFLSLLAALTVGHALLAVLRAP
jgi:hypothetical protein